MARRLHAIGVRGYENDFKLTLVSERLAEPLERRKPTIYFVNSHETRVGRERQSAVRHGRRGVLL